MKGWQGSTLCRFGRQSHLSLYWLVSWVAVAPDRADEAPQERRYEQPPPFSSVRA